MKKYLLVFVMLFSSAVFADDECEAAVDAANRVNPNENKNCDYSNTGLNGVLHRAFAKKSAEDKTSAESVVADKVVTDKVATEKSETRDAVNEAAVKSLVASAEFSSPQQLQNLRFGLIQQTARECAKGFVVEGERYLPVPKSKATKLELIYHCL